jgi:2-methylcitrate dehydratase PrpD
MGRQIEALAGFAAETQWAQVPEAVRRHAKLVILDTLGVMLAGSDRPDARQLHDRLTQPGAAGATVLGRGWPRGDVRMAALLNGISGRSIELCEGLRLVSGQPAIQILPGLLAVGEQWSCGGAQLLSAFLVGYDIAARLCTAFKARPIAHQNGQAILLAAAAAGARLRGLDAAGISLSMRIATTLVLTPSYTNAVHGATALNVAGGMSSFAAALAPDLALAGLTAQPDAVEESLAQLVGDGFDPTNLLEALGARWEITRNYFRLYACCNPIHPALDALKTILGRLEPAGDDIQRIDIATYRFASVMRNPNPPNYFASKYSLPHVAAAMVLTGAASHAVLGDDAVHDPAIVALRHRVHVTEDPTLSAMVPRYKPARVTVVLKDGRTDSETVESHRGDFYQPFGDAEVRDKFHALAGTVLTEQGVMAVEHAVDDAESWQSVGELFDLLRHHGRYQ